MLRELRVKNFAIIEDLSVEFRSGLNILTGETGAGKSIIIGALGIVLGQRAYAEMIMTGHESATVEASFDPDESSNQVLEALGIDASDSIILRRTITRGGKTKAFINDTMVNVQSLAELGRTLVDVHGQHEHQSLLSPESQMRLLDYFGGLDEERAEVSELYEEVSRIERRINDLKLSGRERALKTDMLRFQSGEIEAAGLIDGEDLRLEEERGILSNLTKLKELVEKAHALLHGDEGSALERLGRALDAVREMSQIDDSASGPMEVLESARPLVEDAACSVRDLRDRYDLDPKRLDEVHERLRLIADLKKKYGDTIEAVLAFKAKALEELEGLENAHEATGKLEADLAERRAALEKSASGLTRRRKTAAKQIECKVMPVLEGLAFSKAEFVVSVEKSAITSTGADSVEFLFSANKGEAPKALARVASGGELSRIMLAIKTVLREADRIPVLVFDEVDAGIGGKTAMNVAKRLKESARGRQVLCITHLPQIASVADSHFLIEKSTKSGRSRVELAELSGRAREEEIARMLSGTVTETSLEHAREIMGGKAKSKA